MQERTYEALPSDVRNGLPREAVQFDATIPPGSVDVYSQGRRTRVLVNDFVRIRRKARKAERRNRKAGRR